MNAKTSMARSHALVNFEYDFTHQMYHKLIYARLVRPIEIIVTIRARNARFHQGCFLGFLDQDQSVQKPKNYRQAIFQFV